MTHEVPHAPEAEKGLLSCLMQDGEVASLVGDVVDSSWFFGTANVLVFSAIMARAMAGEREPGNLHQLAQHLSDAGLLERSGGPGYLADLYTFSPSARQWPYFRDVLQKVRARRQLLSAALEVARQCQNTEADVDTLLSDAEAQIQEVADGYNAALPETANHQQKISKTLQRVVSNVEKREERVRTGKMAGLSTGLRDLDNATDGLQGGRSYIFAARPKMGKSSLVRQIILQASRTVPVLYHSLEMSDEQSAEAMLITEGGLDAGEISSGKIAEKTFPKIFGAARRLGDRPIIIDHRPVTVHQIASSARRAKRLHNIGLLVVDYIQRIRPHEKGLTMRESIGYASRMLADLSIQLNIPIVVVAQLNREAEKLTAKELHPGHLKECGDLEQDAAFVGLLGKADAKEVAPDQPRPLGLNIAAQRFGAGGFGYVIPLLFRPNALRFETVANIEEPESASCP